MTTQRYHRSRASFKRRLQFPFFHFFLKTTVRLKHFEKLPFLRQIQFLQFSEFQYNFLFMYLLSFSIQTYYFRQFYEHIKLVYLHFGDQCQFIKHKLQIIFTFLENTNKLFTNYVYKMQN